MTKFYNYINENDTISLIEVYHFMESDVMNEGIKEWTDKIGKTLQRLNIRKGAKRGLLDYLKDAGVGVSKLIWFGIKASRGDQNARDMIAQMTKKEVDRSEVINFLIRLDVVTLGVISMPIRIIEAITGWDIMGALTTTPEDMKRNAKQAIENLENISRNVADKTKETLKNIINRLKELLNLNMEAI